MVRRVQLLVLWQIWKSRVRLNRELEVRGYSNSQPKMAHLRKRLRGRLHSLPFLWIWLLVACGSNADLPIIPTPPTVIATITPTPLPTPLPPPLLTVDETPVPTPTLIVADGRSFPSPAYAIHLSQWWDLEALERDLRLTKEMGFGWVKINFPWRDIEQGRDSPDWWRPDQIVALVEQYDLDLVVRVDRQPLWSVATLSDEARTPHQPPIEYQDFGDFCYKLADRYPGRIAAYQVWNEPNLSREWGEVSPSPAEYTDLLRVCYEGVKTADPQAIVISAGSGSYRHTAPVGYARH